MSKATVRNTVRAAVIMGAARAAPCFYTHRYPEKICQQRLMGAWSAGRGKAFQCSIAQARIWKKEGYVPCSLLRVVPWTL